MEMGESKQCKTNSATARHVTNIPWTLLLASSLYDQHRDVSYKPKDEYYDYNSQ